MADTTETTLVAESTLIPYMRKQDIMFDANNLRPYKVARIFFDDIAMNLFAQKGNKIELNSEKILTVAGNSAHVASGDFVYQGSSNVAPTFSANVKSFNSTTNTLIINAMSGNFDSSANVYVEKSNGVTMFFASVTREENSNTSDIFVMNEGVVCANTQAFMRVIGSSGENILYVNENFININVHAIGANSLQVGAFTVGDLVYQSSTGKAEFNNATFQGKVEYYDVTTGSLALTPVSGSITTCTTYSLTSTLFNSSNASVQAVRVGGFKLVDLATNNRIASVILFLFQISP